MIFRRSLVRELTATTIGLFVVLLAILFTQSVIRILGRAAGGAVAADGVLALIGFNAMFYLNLLLSVALFLTVLLTLSRWYRDSEMVVWFTSGQSLTACLKPIMLFSAPFLVAIVLLSLFLSPWAEQRKLEFERQLEQRDEVGVLSPGPLPRVQARRARRVRREHQSDRRPHPQRVPAFGRRRQGHDDGRPPGPPRGDCPTATASSCWRTAAATKASPGPPNTRSIEFDKLGRRIEPAEARAIPTSDKAMPLPRCCSLDGRPERAELFWRLSVPILALILTLLAIPMSYVNPRIGPLVQPRRRGVPVHGLHQLPQHRAEHDRAGPHRLLDGPSAPARDRRAAGRSCCSGTSCRSPACSGARRSDRRPQPPAA